MNENKKYRNRYRIPSARAVWHNYNGGAYFITVCTKKRVHYFGEIVDVPAVETWRAASLQPETKHASEQTWRAASLHELQLSPIGQYLYENLQNVTIHYPYAEIPLFAVMPNHFHAIVIVVGEKTPYERRIETNGIDVPVPVETRRATSLQCGASQQIANMQGWLSVVIGGVKSAVTKFANENKIEFAWQTRFHDHIIRDQNEMNRIADYIENNVLRWNEDCYNEQNR